MDRRGRSVLQSHSAHKMVVYLVKIIHALAEIAPAMSGQLGILESILFGDFTMHVVSLPATGVGAIVIVARHVVPVAFIVGNLFQVISPSNKKSNRSLQQIRQRRAVDRPPQMSEPRGEVTLSKKWL